MTALGEITSELHTRTVDTLLRVFPHLKLEAARRYTDPLLRAMHEFSIDQSSARVAAFLAQVGHESGGLVYWEEIWGPTDAQRGYEGRKDLGNVVPGDGYRFRGRGPIQITGRANYLEFGAILGLQLEVHPEIAATPEAGFRIASCYWQRRKLNELADTESLYAFREITRRINGGTNGLANRCAIWDRARRALDLPEVTA